MSTYSSAQPLKSCRNMNSLDQVIRLIIGVALIYLGFFNQDLITNPLLGALIGVLGIPNVVSGLAAVCPIYLMANIDTSEKFKTQH